MKHKPTNDEADEKTKPTSGESRPLHAVLGGSKLRKGYRITMHQTLFVNIPNFFFEHITSAEGMPPN